ncbi:iron-containing alcohol dehydrogenase [Tabrizicola sp. BL-A-41-H6]|uniref:iron-containing alcohol dehydrogenase n=1 Tax=Tabrizicola sp. BL-A-41-H6 TaxID=3421107 RepID=UPI003D66504D
MTPFAITSPPRILFGRGEAAKAPGLIKAFGLRGVIVHGANVDRARWLTEALPDALTIICAGEPTLTDLDAALGQARSIAPQWVAAIGGGAVLDMGKALAALIPSESPAMDHLEVVGKSLPLSTAPLPFIAIPTTSGTGAEATRNAVIGLPDHGRKVSLRDDRMIARLAIVDPALTDCCPRGVTLASGLDAVVQVIEPYVSSKATPYTDALTLPVIGPGLAALRLLMEGEYPAARDTMAWVSLCGGLALSNAGLGAVHGFAGVIGGMTGAAHGAICGAMIGPVLAVNRAATSGNARQRLDHVCDIIAAAFGTTAEAAPQALQTWARSAGLPDLADLGVRPEDHGAIVAASASASSMKGNPVSLPDAALLDILRRS